MREKLQEAKNFFMQRNLARENLEFLEREIHNKNQVCSNLLAKMASQKQLKITLQNQVEESLERHCKSDQAGRAILMEDVTELENRFLEGKVALARLKVDFQDSANAIEVVRRKQSEYQALERERASREGEVERLKEELRGEIERAEGLAEETTGLEELTSQEVMHQRKDIKKFETEGGCFSFGTFVEAFLEIW